MAALAEWFRYRSMEPGTRVRVPYVALLYGKIGVMVAYDYGEMMTLKNQGVGSIPAFYLSPYNRCIL